MFGEPLPASKRKRCSGLDKASEFFELLLSQELRSYCWGDCSTKTQERFEKAYELPDIVNSKRAR